MANLNRDNLHQYQKFSVQHIINKPFSALFLEMGLGKTVSTLTAIEELKYDRLEIDKALVIAPKSVARSTWSDEIQKWEHLKHLRISLVLGTEKQRKKALEQDADIYIINRENTAWLVSYYGGSYMPFDMLVIDELSSFKSAKAQRFKALRQVRPLFDRVVGLTGTPAPNGLVDIWSQIYLLDMGKRLGKTVTGFRQKYCREGMKNGHIVYKYHLAKGAEKVIYNKIGDICVSMKSRDYLELPPQIDHTINVKLDNQTLSAYNTFAKERILEMLQGEDDTTITAANAAALIGKLMQFANGAIYDEDKNVKHVHNFKLEAFEQLVEESQGEPILAFYSFKHDLHRIKRLKGIGKFVRELKTPQDIKDWNAGKIKILIAHPASAGHGLNLQHGGSIVAWFGLTYSLELYLQANARLMRQGQTKPVKVFKFAVEDTVDYDIIKALDGKKTGQEALMGAVKAQINKYLG